MVVGAPVGCARPGRPAAPGSLCRGHFSQLPALARSAGGSLRKSRTRTEVQAAAPDTSRPPHAAGRPSCWALTGSPAPRPRGTRQSGCTSRPPRPAPTAPLGPASCRPSPPLLLGPKSQTPPVRLWGLLPALPVFPSGPQNPARLRSSGGLVLPGEASGLTCWAHRGEPQALPRPQLRAATLVPLTGPKRGPLAEPQSQSLGGLASASADGWGGGRTCAAPGTRGHLERKENQHRGVRAHFAARLRQGWAPKPPPAPALRAARAAGWPGRPTRPSHPVP